MITWIGIYLIRPFIKLLDQLVPIGNLAARAWVSWIFFTAGISKIVAWQTTILLFQYEYHVPWMSPVSAAIMGTAAELILPVLLLIGLGGRIVIFAFFVDNLVCMISDPFLWTPDGAAGLAEHINWGFLLALLMFYGPSKLSLDHLIFRWHIHKTRDTLYNADGI